MNILMVHNYYQFPGGEDMVVENEKNMLVERGHRVVLYTRNNSELKDMNGLQKGFMAFSAVFSMRTYREVRKLIKQEKIDVVNVHNTLSLISPSVYYAAISLKKPVYQTVHNFRLMCPGATFYRNSHICEDCIKKGLGCAVRHSCYRGSRLQSLASAMILKVHRITGIYKKINYICLTEFNKHKLLSGMKGLKESQIYVKPNFTKENPDIKGQTFENRKYYLYGARLEKIKGTDKLLKAWKKLDEDGIRPQLIVCGTGDMEEKCKAFVKKNNLENICFKGQVPNDELKKLMAAAKAVILPSQWYEGFPVSIAESYSLGTPVITGDVGNAGDLVINGITGYKYTYDSFSELAKTILKMEELESDRYMTMSVNTREKFEKYYTEDINYKLLCDIYGNH